MRALLPLLGVPFALGFDASFTPKRLDFASVMANSSAAGLLIHTVLKDGVAVVEGLPLEEEAGAAAINELTRRLVPAGGATAATDFFLDTNVSSQVSTTYLRDDNDPAAGPWTPRGLTRTHVFGQRSACQDVGLRAL